MVAGPRAAGDGRHLPVAASWGGGGWPAAAERPRPQRLRPQPAAAAGGEGTGREITLQPPEIRQTGTTAPARPQVALLFLTDEAVIHERFWRLWFASAAGLLPVEQLRQRLCSGTRPEEEEAKQTRLLRDCLGISSGQAAGGDGADEKSGLPLPGRSARAREEFIPGSEVPASDVIGQQHLFDVFVHPHINFTGWLRGSLP